MKLKYKYQSFQADAAKAVTDVFAGQPKSNGQPNLLIDQGKERTLFGAEGYGNDELRLSDDNLLTNVRHVQQSQGLEPVGQLQGRTFTIEMETGTGKTYTYIKTMYELNAKYGWSKFIVVVPSVAIREGVYKSFQSTEEHFAADYGQRIQYFIYNSSQLNKIDAYAGDAGLQVMIINMQAFNTSLNEEKGTAARRGDRAARIIFTERDEFGSRKPIDILAQTRPILIIDEPQSVLGTNKNNATRKGLERFRPLFSLRYSATHRREDICNMVYRLDAIDAYNRKLVKKIAVKGIRQCGTEAKGGYVYLEEVMIGKGNPRARLTYDHTTAEGVVAPVTELVDEGCNLYDRSGKMEEYKDSFVVEHIDGHDGTVQFLNGLTLSEGDSHGRAGEDQLRRTQIRETIRTHIERERQLFTQHIKVLSLFFIDHVASYRCYDNEEDTRGKFARMFEEEYPLIVAEMLPTVTDARYRAYLQDPRNAADRVHQGYFSQDKKGHLTDPKCKARTMESDDESAYDLIMKDKERLLSIDEPVRFLFSHSALKEGWDNPNVFQICTLKDSDNITKKRQEVGRGMRLCVNGKGERQDAEVLGSHVFDTNILTVIASESYDVFSRQLQQEMADACGDRPKEVTAQLFEGMNVTDANGKRLQLTHQQATMIYLSLAKRNYVDDENGALTDLYFAHKAAGTLDFGSKANVYKEDAVQRLESVYDARTAVPDNARRHRTARFVEDNFRKETFQELWHHINVRSSYRVNFSSGELIDDAIQELDGKLGVTKIHIVVEQGAMEKIDSKEALESGTAMKASEAHVAYSGDSTRSTVRYDLIGEIAESTGLTRRTIVEILQGVNPETFDLFAKNPEEFTLNASRIINDCKAQLVVDNIVYKPLNSTFEEDIFSASTLRGMPGQNAIESKKSLYDLVVVDSHGIEKSFAEELEKHQEVSVYTKLPRGFYINTPMGHYNPDWAIALKKDKDVKHIYFVAETKGNSQQSSQLRGAESAKIACASKHFAAISTDQVKYSVVKDYKELYDKAMSQ